MDYGQITDLLDYRRLEHEGVGIYVHPDYPDWLVPSSAGDRLLRAIIERGSPRQALNGMDREARLGAEQFLVRLPRGGRSGYSGRADHLTLKQLKECWFHLTNRCNLNCVHCMFSSGPAQGQQLSPEQLTGSIREVQGLGCKLFYFTGGEPSIWAGFPDVCRSILEDPQAHVVILTNGVTLQAGDRELLTLDRDRTHFQISLDGAQETHDAIRGRDAYRRVETAVGLLRDRGYPVSLAMAVSQTNVHQMQELVSIAAAWDVKNIHYLWFFRKGKGQDHGFVPAQEIARQLLRAYDQARETGVLIDNVEIVKSQVFSLPGTRFDLSNAGWQALAVGPDGAIYPSPALIGDPGMRAGHIADGIEEVWGNSPVLRDVRQASITQDPVYAQNPLKFLVGGGDIDHSFIASGTLTGGDPYVDVYNRVALAVIAEQASQYRSDDRLALLSRMGERLYECGEDMGEVAFTHSNCVLSLPGQDGHALVKNFYSAAAEEPNEEIFNPVSYDESDIGHVPKRSRVRSYGCGSPVLDSDVKPGETLVDLGSGTGVECFIAAKKVGPEGRVIGIDMADAMLAVAEESKVQVVSNLGYDNVSFKKAFFEQTPVDSDSVDVIISNCVINLSPDKRRTFSEVFRMLKSGGRAVISDICYEDDIPLDIKYNEKLRGECIGGAFKQDELFGLLRDVGFDAAHVVKRFPYRAIAGYTFYSITYDVRKPRPVQKQRLLYRGPFAAVVTGAGQVMPKGVTTEVMLAQDFPHDSSVFCLDEAGQVTNVAQEISCSCAMAPSVQDQAPAAEAKHVTGCMVCGAELVYSQANSKLTCYYCGQDIYGNVVCQDGHFVCDTCHAHDALSIIRDVCLGSTETDMIALMEKIRNHPAFPLHGPEHHSMVPAIILAAYRNLTGKIDDEQILMGMERGGTYAGGGCAFFGVCGAAVGVGIAFSIILRSDPYKGKERQIVQEATACVLQAIGRYKAPRCCQRDCWVALREVARFSECSIGVSLKGDRDLACLQSEKNRECVRGMCPLYEERDIAKIPISERRAKPGGKTRGAISTSGQ